MGIKSLVAGSIADEWSLENETSAYSLAKKRIRDYVNEQASAFITLMRFHYIFSEAEFRPRILSQVRENALTRITNPNRMHDFIHIRDTVEAIYGLLRSSTPSIVDIASGRLHTVTQLVQIFLERERVSFCQKTCGVSNVNLNFLKSIEWSPTETNRYFHGNSDTLFK
jgi:nucleoside-diphosphate-sugar epimerase